MSHVLILVEESDPVKVFWKKTHTLIDDQINTFTQTGKLKLNSSRIQKGRYDTPTSFPIGKLFQVIVHDTTDDKQYLGIILNTDTPQDEYVRIEEIIPV